MTFVVCEGNGPQWPKFRRTADCCRFFPLFLALFSESNGLAEDTLEVEAGFRRLLRARERPRGFLVPLQGIEALLKGTDRWVSLEAGLVMDKGRDEAESWSPKVVTADL